MSKPPPVTFAGYVSPAKGKLVQEWYDSLTQIDRDEILDQVNYLSSMPVTEWRRPEFDKVTPPLAEIRCKSSQTNHTIRLYGVFDEKIRGRFIILNATEAKKKDRDQDAQNIAIKRLGLIKTGKANTHGFKFEKGIDRADSKEQEKPLRPRLVKR
jgi:hypothetical protein